MTWTGEVKRRCIAWTPRWNGGLLTLECGHTAVWDFKSIADIPRQGLYCPECSAPYEAKIREQQLKISFDDVLSKLKQVYEEPHE